LIRVFNKIKVDPAELEKKKIFDDNKPDHAKGSILDNKKQQAKHGSQDKMTKGSTQMLD
jgi:hypothetical protein